MTPPGADAVVVRFGEVYTKSDAVRDRMVGRLADNVAAILGDRGLDGAVERKSGRLVIRTDAPDAAADAAADVPGVVSTSAACSVPSTRDAIADALERIAPAVHGGDTFAVDANRGYGGLPFTSEDVGEFGGAAVSDALDDPAVDLDDPDTVFHVDCRRDETFVFTGMREGPGGLPVGTQEPLVALVSGGIDSPVAAFEAMRRGSPIVPMYLDLGDYGGPDHRARAVSSMATLRSFAPHRDDPALVVPAGDTVAEIAASIGAGRMLAFRRFCVLVGAEIARREGARGIVTGEVIGQKSSQTAANLAVTSAVADLPVHRPLLTVDKTEVIERARGIGTFADASIPAGCNRFAPDRPMTAATVEAVRDREPADLAARAEAAAAAAERVDLDAERA